MNWTANQVDFYYDGVFAGSVGAYIAGSPVYLVFDYTAGSYGGPTVTGTTMQVDWVRVWTAGPVRTAPAMGTLEDNFGSASTLNSLWNFSTDTDAAVSIGGGQAAIPCDTSGEELASGTIYNLTGSHIYAKVTPAAGSGCISGLELDDGSQDAGTSAYNSIGWQYTVGGSLIAFITQAATGTQVGSLTYSATAHAWWRIREASGVLYWDTAPDGLTWTNQFSYTYSINVTILYALFYATAGTVTTDYTYIDNVNTIGAGGYGATGQVVLSTRPHRPALKDPLTPRPVLAQCQ
jgi:hypothetical protein